MLVAVAVLRVSQMHRTKGTNSRKSLGKQRELLMPQSYHRVTALFIFPIGKWKVFILSVFCSKCCKREHCDCAAGWTLCCLSIQKPLVGTLILLFEYVAGIFPRMSRLIFLRRKFIKDAISNIQTSLQISENFVSPVNLVYSETVWQHPSQWWARYRTVVL